MEDGHNGHNGGLHHVQEPDDVAARELDIRRSEALDAIDRAPFSCVVSFGAAFRS